MNTQLRDLGLIYLATPYSKYPDGIDRAWLDACKLTARMLRAGAKVYSPIAHTHPVAIHGEIDPLDHKIWLPFDEAMMAAAAALVVAKMTGWESSQGIAHEIRFFAQARKPAL